MYEVGERGFIRKLGSNGLKRWLGKISRAGFGVEEFIGGFYIRIIKVRYGVKNCLG